MEFMSTPDFDEWVASLRARLAERKHLGDPADEAALVRALEAAYTIEARPHVPPALEAISALGRSAEELRAEHERVLAGLPTAIVTTDAHGAILSANEAARAFLVDQGDLTGRDFVSLFDGDGSAQLATDLAEVLRSGRGLNRALQLAEKSSEGTMSVTASASVVRFGGDALVSWVLQSDAAPWGPELARRLPRALISMARLPSVCLSADQLVPRAAEIAQASLGQDLSVSLMVGDPRAPELISSTSQLGQALDGAQILADEGPCLDAYATGEAVSSPDLREDTRWPRLLHRVQALPVGGVVALPVDQASETAGAFNVFTPPGRPPRPDLMEACQLLLSAVEAALTEVTAKTELSATADGMRAALVSRAVIDQAKGIVMADKGCTADEAFAHLLELSSRSHVKVRDVAAALVEMTVSRS
jgi:PAS domain-containing protein